QLNFCFSSRRNYCTFSKIHGEVANLENDWLSFGLNLVMKAATYRSHVTNSRGFWHSTNHERILRYSRPIPLWFYQALSRKHQYKPIESSCLESFARVSSILFEHNQHSTRSRKDNFVNGTENTCKNELPEQTNLTTVKGWIKSVRKAARDSLLFVELNDGSCYMNLQIVVPKYFQNFTSVAEAEPGYSYQFTGQLRISPGKHQPYELYVSNSAENHEAICFGDVTSCESISYFSPQHLETVDPSNVTLKLAKFSRFPAHLYPLSKKFHSKEYLRRWQHLRARTTLYGAITRLRSALSLMIHTFFQERGYFLVSTPIISTSDCEGAGRRFKVSPETNSSVERTANDTDLYFKVPAYLTVSGQLSLESYCSSMSNVYSFGPVFRAENSNTVRHLAEFWMIEAESAFVDLERSMKIIEELLLACFRWARSHTRELGCLPKSNYTLRAELFDLENITAIARMSYTDAISRMQFDVFNKKVRFVEFPTWGIDLKAEHENYLTEHVCKGPVLMYNHPKNIKPFYMRLNDDNQTVASVDVLFPHIGEVAGGSQREERLHYLDKRMEECNISHSHYQYRDLRKYGTVPHSGFGIGLERLMMLLFNIENIRDTIPFPRYRGHALT
ncbi:hypothetical protein IE077_003200, partial [Cardiosporidium cionae]